VSTFTYTPDFRIKKNISTKVRLAKFGDNYEQRQADGVNPFVKVWNLEFTQRLDAEADAIILFFETAKGVDSFDWTDPQGVAGKYVCRQWSYDIPNAGRKNITADFELVYEP